MSISFKILEEVTERDNYKCQGCGSTVDMERTSHHCYFRSKYLGKNRDQPFNLVTICRKCHYEIHSKGNQKLRKKFEQLAFERADEETKKALTNIK